MLKCFVELPGLQQYVTYKQRLMTWKQCPSKSTATVEFTVQYPVIQLKKQISKCEKLILTQTLIMNPENQNNQVFMWDL